MAIHTKKTVRVVLLLTVLGILFAVGIRFFMYGATPWDKTGSVALVVQAVPNPLTPETTVHLGIDDVRLHSYDSRIPASLLTRRMIFEPNNRTLTLLLDTPLRVGVYQGMSFTLTSPALSNPWQGDEPPEHITLAHGSVHLPIPFSVRADMPTVLIVSFETTQALHTDGESYVYLPVIRTEVRDDAVVEEASAGVVVRDGTVTHSATYGMDWDGLMHQNFRARRQPSEASSRSEVPISPAATQDVVVEHEEQIASSTHSTSTMP